MGIWFRINDKVERIKTILMRGDNGSLKGEGLVDSYSDISNYGVMHKLLQEESGLSNVQIRM